MIGTHPTLDSKPLPHCFTEEHKAFRAAARAFVRKKIAPFVNEWDEAGEFPREVYSKSADIGLLGVGYPQT